jgi:hypothetical protein
MLHHDENLFASLLTPNITEPATTTLPSPRQETARPEHD